MKPCLPVLAFGLALLGGCERGTGPVASAPAAVAPSTRTALAARSAAQLRMHIDGAEWSAAHDLFGAVNPTGHDRAVIIAGSRGGKNANEQAFNLTLFGIDAPGRYRVTSTQPSSGVAQISNLDAKRFLAGNLFGYELDVELVRRSTDPELVEARFSGTLTANDGEKVPISDGYFFYDATNAP